MSACEKCWTEAQRRVESRVIPYAAEIRAWTQRQIRAQRAYRERETALNSPTNCPECGAKRDGRHSLCWRCRNAYKKPSEETR